MRTIGLLLAIILTIFASACTTAESTEVESTTEETEQSATYQTITIDELADIMAEEDRSHTVVNVHIPYQGEIEGTDSNIAYNDINALTTSLPHGALEPTSGGMP